MSLLDITGLSHSFGDNTLFKDAKLSLNKGEHVGIVGQNGAGKSTFIKLCTEQIIPDSGAIIWQPKISVGYLDQYAQIKENVTMRTFLKSAFKDLYKMEEKMNDLYQQASVNTKDATSLKQAFYYQELLDLHDFYSIDTKIEQVSTGLGLTVIGLDQQINQMSGGQRAKVILAKLLLEKPDVLLLDEPTNFLDKEHIAWLSNYLSSLEKAYMVVSHDFDFLEKISTWICDIDNFKIMKYNGTYSEFLKKKTLLKEDYIRQYTAQQKEIEKTEAFIRQNIAGRKSKMARGRQKQLDRMDRMEGLNQKEVKPVFSFLELPSTKVKHLTVKNLFVGYHDSILSDLNFSISGGQKIVLTGFNGVGKSTLLKTLVNLIPAIQGEFFYSKQVTIGYFEQDLCWDNEILTPIQLVSNSYPNLDQKEIRKNLSRCGISSKHAQQSIKTLSGGEQAKVKICLLTLKPCNFLIMDEPTNHLDIQAKVALKTALINFSGTTLVVSHEESFYKDWAQRIIQIGTNDLK